MIASQVVHGERTLRDRCEMECGSAPETAARHDGDRRWSRRDREPCRRQAAPVRDSGALAVDMESQIAARIARRHELPFVALRAISDAATRGLPPAALVRLKPNGRVRLGGVLRSLMSEPFQIAGADDRPRSQQGVRGATPLPRCPRAFSWRPGSRLACARHGARRRTRPAAAARGSISGAIGPSVFTPRISERQQLQRMLDRVGGGGAFEAAMDHAVRRISHTCRRRTCPTRCLPSAP